MILKITIRSGSLLRDDMKFTNPEFTKPTSAPCEKSTRVFVCGLQPQSTPRHTWSPWLVNQCLLQPVHRLWRLIQWAQDRHVSSFQRAVFPIAVSKLKLHCGWVTHLDAQLPNPGVREKESEAEKRGAKLLLPPPHHDAGGERRETVKTTSWV